MKLNQYQRAKLNKVLIIVAVAIGSIAVIALVYYLAMKDNSSDEVVNYDDTVIPQSYFVDIAINRETNEVRRDKKDTTLQEEFNISDEQANLILGSTEELNNFFKDTTIEVDIGEKVIHLKAPYQTRTLFVEADTIKDNFDATDEVKLQDGLYMLKYDSQKRAKAAFEFLQNQDGINKVEADKVSIVNTINDESQTVYGEAKADDEKDAKSHGVSAMGINKYKKIIKDNGNPSNVTIATIGYGASIENEYFNDRISEDYYNFIDDKKEIHETIPQGSRILEVIKESTTDNIKILPLVVVNDENYTTTSSIIQAITFATRSADVICYEFVHEQNYMIDLTLQNSFKENVPVCCVTKMAKDEEEQIYPANNATTIAVSSVDKDLKTTSYSGSGEYIDFVASSTDVEEIFNKSSSVSRWSGAGYSNAHIASLIALIKTYNKEFTILEVYNFIRNYCRDLGTEGKDITYGYGFPDFNGIKMSDIDKKTPELKEITIDNEKWEKEKKLAVKAEDNIRIYGWNVTKSQDVPKEWKKLEGKTNLLDASEDLKENASYYIWVTDSAGNVAYVNKEITKIDNAGPKIEYTVDESKKDTEKYVTINIVATDDGSGLHDMPYSWDKQNWGIDSNILKVTQNGTYTIYVRDKLENISEQTITIKSFPQEGRADIDGGTIIKNIKVSSNWEGKTNKEITITFNDNLSIQKWKITDKDEVPSEFIETQHEDDEPDSDDENVTGDNTVENEIENENNTTPENSTNNSNENEPTANEQQSNNNSQGFTNVTVTVSLKADKKYYLWIKDSNGNVVSQGFTIKKVQ